MTTPRQNAAAVELNGKLHVIGGAHSKISHANTEPQHASVEKCNPVEESWTEVASLNQ